MGRIKSNDRQMTSEAKDDGTQVFFFPKNNPPISIRATSREEAERKLEALNRKEA
jgi:PDZ domain-containing secreted protein